VNKEKSWKTEKTGLTQKKRCEWGTNRGALAPSIVEVYKSAPCQPGEKKELVFEQTQSNLFQNRHEERRVAIEGTNDEESSNTGTDKTATKMGKSLPRGWFEKDLSFSTLRHLKPSLLPTTSERKIRDHRGRGRDPEQSLVPCVAQKRKKIHLPRE